jgi:alpha-galactosidase
MLFAKGPMMQHRTSTVLLAISLTLLGLLTCIRGRSQEPILSKQKSIRVFCLDPVALTLTKTRIRDRDPAVQPAYERLLAEADRALHQPPLSVMDKANVPPSGDKHDYRSIAPYFWPDPLKKDGLPYIRKDGERNPESSGKNTDAPHFGRICSAVETLSLAYYLSGKESYAEHAALLLRTWFLEPATRMNPNLNYGQAIAGRVEGRGTGIIETVRLIQIVDSVGLLASSSAWGTQDQAGMVAWMKPYLNWLQTSKNGRDEQRAANNHGTYYDAQVVSLALFTDQKDLARRVLEEAREKRIAAQIRPDGSQPLELERTKSFSYSVFNLKAMTELADLGERVGVDLWHYKTADERSIRKAIDFLAAYTDPQKIWPYKQITSLDRASLLPILRKAYLRYHDDSYRKYIARIPQEQTIADRERLLTPDERILTPKPPATPRINGTRVFGARPGRPFLFTIPATGDEPITYSAEGLPKGLTLDARLGRITGKVAKEGNYQVKLFAVNALGKDSKPLLIKIGDRISLTPPMGWNSWNCFAGAVNQDRVREAAEAMVRSGLIKHGWSYINIDDTWQGSRGGPYHAIQGNAKFPDLKRLCDEIHALGLKAGIYSTPWVTSYAGYPGGSAENSEGTWTKFSGTKQVNKKILPWAVGKHSFARQDAKQWADWGFDYLKYDWNPIEPPQVEEMGSALKETGRDFIFSLSNHAAFEGASDWARLANCWRTTGDIRDNWKSVTSIGFSQDKWARFAGPGHWNDPDMLVVGKVGWGPKLHPTNLTSDEQYTHITLWCLLSAPLLIGCDMTQIDDFTISLLSNDEVLAVDQDPLGKSATRVREDLQTGTEVWMRPLSDGTIAVGLFNRGRYEIEAPRRPRRGEQPTQQVWKLLDRATGKTEEFGSEAEAQAQLLKSASSLDVTADWSDLHLSGSQPVRDLWRQQDLGSANCKITATVNFHGVVMLKIGIPHDPAIDSTAQIEKPAQPSVSLLPPSSATSAPRFWSVALADW